MMRLKGVLATASLLLALSPWARAASLCAGPAADYVIVTPASWVTSFDAYVATKTSQGIPTRVFSLEDIIANYAGADTQEKIRAFHIDAYNTWGISYVLLGGAETVVPVRYRSGLIYDAYYFVLTGDGYSGAPTVLGGRLPAWNASQGQMMLNHWAQYDGDGTWNRNMLYCGWAGNEFSGIAKFNGTQLGEGSLAPVIQSYINSGCAMVTYVAHGYYSLWANVGFQSDDARALANGAKLPFVLAGSCLTGKFDEFNCIAEAFFEGAGGGAIGYVGANRTIWSDEAYGMVAMVSNGVEAAYFDNGRARPSAAYHFSLGASSAFNFLGDPTAEMDFRLAGDLTPPTVSGAYLGRTLLVAYQSLSCSAQVTDNDEVSSHVWAEVTKPDSQVVNITLAREGYYTSRYTGQISDTGQLGVYTVVVKAQDISGNLRTDAPMQFTVSADASPPTVLFASVDAVDVPPLRQVVISSTVTDNSGAGLQETVTITRPDLSVFQNTGPWWGSYWFDDTSQPGNYKVTLQYMDRSGNSSTPYAIINLMPDDAFRVINDTTPPVVNAVWLIDTSVMNFPQSPGQYAVTAIPFGHAFSAWIDTVDDYAGDGGVVCTEFVRQPDGSTLENMMWWGGMAAYPPGTGYSSMQVPGDQVGFYSVTVTACDKVGNTAYAYAGNLNVYRPASELSANPGNNRVDLAWVAAASGYPIAGYNVHRSLIAGDSNTVVVNAGLISGTAFANTSGVFNGTTYYYRVLAVDASGATCGASNEVAATPTNSFVPPLAPLGVTVTASDGQLNLAWQPGVAGTSPTAGYQLYRATTPGGQGSAPINPAIIPGLAYGDTTVANGVRYYYRLKTQDTGATLSAFSLEVSEVPFAPASIPANVTATASTSQVQLSWAPSTAGTYALAGYQIYRALTPGGQGSVAYASVNSAVASYSDTVVANGTSYYYQLASVDVLNHLSARSSEASATPNWPWPSAPANPSALGLPGRVQLTWDNNAAADCLTQYSVYRGTAAGVSCTPANYLGQIPYNEFSTPFYQDFTAVPGITYYYRVTAVNPRGASAPSAEVSAAAQQPPTATATPTRTITPTASHTPTISPTPTVTPTLTVTPTVAGVVPGLDRVLAFPNPSRGDVTFAWPQGTFSAVRIDVFNPAGERLASLAADRPAANSLLWRTAGVSAGVYYYRLVLTTLDGTSTSAVRKVVILR